MKDVDPQRRDLLALGALSILGMPLVASTAPLVIGSGRTQIDFSDPVENLDAYVRMMGSSDGAVRYFWGFGTAFAVLPGQLAMPLFNAVGAQWVRFRRRSDGSYLRDNAFVQMHYSLEGQFIDSMANPLTGKRITVPLIHNEFATVAFTAAGIVIPPELQAETSNQGKPFVRPWISAGDDLWMLSDDFVRYYSKRFARRVVENGFRTHQVSLRELTDRGRPSVAMRGGEAAITDWIKFLEMPDESPGYMVWRFVSRKFDSLDDFPAEARADVERHSPALWNIPA